MPLSVAKLYSELACEMIIELLKVHFICESKIVRQFSGSVIAFDSKNNTGFVGAGRMSRDVVIGKGPVW